MSSIKNDVMINKVFAIFLCFAVWGGRLLAQEKTPLVRMARIVIDPSQLGAYRAALQEGIETAVRVEPGVLSLYAVYEKDRPTHVTVMEVYADQAAYQSHLQTEHFKKYKRITKDMVRSLELVDVVPIGLGKK